MAWLECEKVPASGWEVFVKFWLMFFYWRDMFDGAGPFRLTDRDVDVSSC
jgi:hypothetical protein